MRRIQRIRLNVDWSAWKRLLAEAAPLAAGSIMATLYYRVDSVMLSKLDTFSSVGVYNVAYKFVDLVHYLPKALMVPVLAILVRSWPEDLHRFSETFRRAFMILVLTGILVAVEFAVFAEPLISLLYGARYSEAAGAGRVVVAAECIGGLGMLALTALVAMGRNRLYPLAALVGLAVNVGLNLVLIPRASYFGAAVATLVTEVLIVAMLVVPVARMAELRPLPLRPVGYAVLAGAVSALVAAVVGQAVPWPLAALVAAVAFGVLVHLGKVAGPQGWRSLMEGPSPRR